MQNRTGFAGIGLKDKLIRFLQVHKKWVRLSVATVSGYVMASSSVFGGVSPFGAAFCASLPLPFATGAALGALLGYIFSPTPLTNMKYLAAVLLVIGLKWLFGGKLDKRYSTLAAAVTTLVSLGVSGIAVAVLSDVTLYDLLLIVAEIFMGAGAAYFFSRSLLALESGWVHVNRSDISCLIVSFAVVVMGFSAIQVGGLSLGRALAVLVVLLCARAGGESGGSVAGISAGIAMGLCGGDYAYAIAAYGFGGLLSGVFSSLGRIATVASFIIVNAVAALFTKSTHEVYVALMEIFVASVAFIAIPQSAMGRLRQLRPGQNGEGDFSTQGALQGRLGEISGALRDLSDTTRRVSQHLGKMESSGHADLYNKIADRVCTHCGRKTTCWQFQYTDTMNAMNDAMVILKREGSINRERMPRYFSNSCCRLEDFISEMNIQFQSQVAREGVQRKVGRVRGVVTDQFEGIAMMLDEISGEICGVTLLETAKQRRVQEYFEGEGFGVRQVRCFSDDFQRITAEVVIPSYEQAKIKPAKTAVDLSALLEAEFDHPYLAASRDSTIVSYTEKAVFVVELGAYQVASKGNKLCGDTYETILNRSGYTHLILSDGMGSGGGAAVDSHMATDLLSRLLSVSFSHEAALKMVNSALLIKSGEESLATVDVCTIDLYTGRTTFYKAGAAPTFMLRSGRAGYVESTSLPAGILQGVGFDKSATTLKEGDVVVMVSDGVTATGADWVKSELASCDTTDMQRLAEKLAMTAKLRRIDGREDDITVLAAALRKGI